MKGLKPVEASLVVGEPELSTLIVNSGGVLVNDIFLPIWQRDYNILLLYGGRGGGKSEAECDNLLDECLKEEYFKCYYGRKVFDTVRGSCFATLVYCIKKNKLEHLFTFSESEHSSMVITCKENGNQFIPFGSDKASKLKSIKDPTHIWCEEFDQFDFTDFKALYPTLRTIRGANRFAATFNTHDVYPDHWILKLFFPKLYEGTDKDDVQMVDILKGKNVKKVFVNYTDNYFIDQEAYRQNLWISAAGNQSIFEGVANGAWGINLNESPYAFAFDRRKHVSNPDRGVAHPVLNRNERLLLSFDFNRNPMSCIVSQLYDGHLYVLEAIKLPRSGVEGICTYIQTYYPGCLYVVTGDYNGNNESSLFAEQVTHYKLIKQYLNLSDGQIQVGPNPKQAKNSTHVNNVLAWFPITIHAIKASGLVFDLENVKRRADGTILKEDRDKPDQQADLLDCFRYLVNEFLRGFDPITYAASNPVGMPVKVTSSDSPKVLNFLMHNAKERKEGADVMEDAILAIEAGLHVICTKNEYQSCVRNAILEAAGKWIDGSDSVRAQIALMEVKRLDEHFAE